MNSLEESILLLNFSWSLSYREKLRKDFPLVHKQILGELNKVKRPKSVGDKA